MTQRVPQPVLSPLTTAASFLVLTVDAGGEPVVRDLLADVPALQRSVGFRAPEGRLSCVAGIGSQAWDRLFAGPRPAELHETSVYGYPLHEHIARLLDGRIIWAPAVDGAFLLSSRGGDFEPRIGQDVSIGYLSHDANSVELYFQETLTFLVHTAEAAVALVQSPGALRREPA
ncbi:encapsulin [Nonomuraea sp. LPB2021202275-12-8]|uniref:encapsulin n=1 Tax=Nonomuraea sp. LPB2021202275-12-8 TaxID=3120159 RepID=UPI00300D8915